jgi:hypothetical protein
LNISILRCSFSKRFSPIPAFPGASRPAKPTGDETAPAEERDGLEAHNGNEHLKRKNAQFQTVVPADAGAHYG